MKYASTAAILLLASVPAAALPQEAARSLSAERGAFHAEGRLACSACHAMSAGGVTPANATAACLSCHDTAGARASDVYGGTTAPKVKGVVGHELPGGLFDPARPGNGHTLAGWSGALSVAPGGDASSGRLGCASCHDPHGEGSSFRRLRKTVNLRDVSRTIAGDRATLVTPGRSADQNAPTGPANHNVYRGDMSGWCGACHGNFNASARTGPGTESGHWSLHPSGVPLTSSTAANYGPLSDFAYPVETSSPAATPRAEWSLVASESRVFCLSCHQAHGSGFSDAVRWDLKTGSGETNGRMNKCGRCHGL